ncbi:MAG: CBO0543 family protein [Bacteroidota bacterium]
MAYIITTIILWLICLVLVQFKGLREYYPTIIFTALLGILSDILGIVFTQWRYHGPTVGSLSLWSVMGIAPAEGGLFIRFFPTQHRWLLIISYLLFWSLLNTAGEWFFMQAGWIEYIKWNSLRAFLFYFFFFGAVWLQEYWYNGTGRLRKHE